MNIDISKLHMLCKSRDNVKEIEELLARKREREKGYEILGILKIGKAKIMTWQLGV